MLLRRERNIVQWESCELSRTRTHARAYSSAHTQHSRTAEVVPRVFARALIKLQLKQPAARARRNFPPLRVILARSLIHQD
jgi:hypothetical protein